MNLWPFSVSILISAVSNIPSNGDVLDHIAGILGSDIPNKYRQSTMNALSGWFLVNIYFYCTDSAIVVHYDDCYGYNLLLFCWYINHFLP